MTRRPRRNHSAAFKAEVAAAAIKGEKTMVELAQEFDPHANQIKHWKDQLLEGASGVFDAVTCHCKNSSTRTSRRLSAALAEIRNRLKPGAPIEIEPQDEARVRQKNFIIRRRARRGIRPSAPKGQRTKSVCLFEAICPRDGKGAALVMLRSDAGAMNRHLVEISKVVTPGAHAVLLLDQAG